MPASNVLVDIPRFKCHRATQASSCSVHADLLILQCFRFARRTITREPERELSQLFRRNSHGFGYCVSKFTARETIMNRITVLCLVLLFSATALASDRDGRRNDRTYSHDRHSDKYEVRSSRHDRRRSDHHQDDRHRAMSRLVLRLALGHPRDSYRVGLHSGHSHQKHHSHRHYGQHRHHSRDHHQGPQDHRSGRR
jgi:hypothetical protein